jgi:hypothetical protein
MVQILMLNWILTYFVFSMKVYSFKINTPTFAFDECSFDQNNGSLFATSGINDFLKLEPQNWQQRLLDLY